MKRAKVYTITGLLLVAAALLLSGYNLLLSRHAGKAADNVLDELRPQISEAVPMPDLSSGGSLNEVNLPFYAVDPNIPMPVRWVGDVEYIGTLQLPTLGLELPISSLYSMDLLNVAPCRYYGSAYLDNLVICAHNFDYHFGRLKNLRLDDSVIITDVEGNEFDYRVMEIEKLEPDQDEEMLTADTWDLTLFTCTVGGASRVAVRCEKLK